jgi:hypothetical protein
VAAEHNKDSKDRDKGLEEVLCRRLLRLLADHKEEVKDDK